MQWRIIQNHYSILPESNFMVIACCWCRLLKMHMTSSTATAASTTRTTNTLDTAATVELLELFLITVVGFLPSLELDTAAIVELLELFLITVVEFLPSLESVPESIMAYTWSEYEKFIFDTISTTYSSFPVSPSIGSAWEESESEAIAAPIMSPRATSTNECTCFVAQCIPELNCIIFKDKRSVSLLFLTNSYLFITLL